MFPRRLSLPTLFFVVLAGSTIKAVGGISQPVDVRSYATLQEAIDANPGRVIQLPDGDYELTTTLRINTAGTGLCGPARITQTNAQSKILEVQDTKDVRLENLCLTRSEGKREAAVEAVEIRRCRNVSLSKVEVSENHTHSSILVADGGDVTIQNCRVINYKGVTIDDRTRMEQYGYAFKAIDGTGIDVLGSEGVVIRDNIIRESNLLPTKETRDKYDLGTLTVKPEKPGRLAEAEMIRTGYTPNWHQGAAIHVGLADKTTRLIILGNLIENAAQGMDLHGDDLVVSSNIISHAMIGIKVMHGAKHALVNANQFSYVDLWGILLYPGGKSRLPVNEQPGIKEQAENVDGGTIVSNNIFSDFGFGEQYWNWVGRKTDYPELNCIAILFGALPENPPIRDVLVTGNLIYDSGRDGMRIEGKWQKQPPRYNYGLYVEQSREPKPVNVRAYGNMISPGLKGGTNLEQY